MLGSSDGPDVFGPNSYPYGRRYEEWSIEWWKWLLSIPKMHNPLLDRSGENCGQHQPSGPVWFLAGTPENTEASRNCIIPTSKAIMLPINNSLCSFAADDGKTVDELRRCADKQEAQVRHLEAAVDGRNLPNLRNYRVQSSPFSIDISGDNVLEVQPGVTTAVSDGYWIILKPLLPGMHKIDFGAQGTYNGSHFRTHVKYSVISKQNSN